MAIQGTEKAQSGREPDARSEWSFSCNNDGSLFGKEAGCFPTFSFYLLIQGLHYKDCVLGQDVHNPIANKFKSVLVNH